MTRRLVRLLLVAGLFVAASRAALPGGALLAQQEEPTSPRIRLPLTILQVNDIYTTVPIEGRGGLARIATLKKQMAAEGRTPLVMLAGDFLSPSVASSVFKGEQMVAGLNAAGLDMATLGNHEFDFGTDVLLQRMKEAQWQWIVSNVVDTNTDRPVGDAAPWVVRTFNGIKVGFLGLCLTEDEITPERLRHLKLIDPIEAAEQYLPVLKQEGAQVIIALTHLTFEEDRALAARFPEIDLIVGGHEHYPITAFENRTLISKAGSDGKWVARIDINRRADGTMERFYELMPITDVLPDDPKTAEVVARYEARLGGELDTVIGRSAVDLDADSVRMRAAETNIGNMFADAMRLKVSADIAIVNSGAIRGDRIFPAGPLPRRTLIAMHPFGNVVCKLEMSGAAILEALNNGVSRLPASDGRFPQISGMTMHVRAMAPVGNRVSDVRIGGAPLEPAKLYTVAVTNFQLAGGDGYDTLRNQRVLLDAQAGPLVESAIEEYVAGRGSVNPSIERRITVER